jgi:L,D-peptidoglycan transpeptidase YkuD (ErfK/YbiS/YcfS/YnhG family)
MHIIINKKKLFINQYKVKCAIGKRGIGHKRKEGDHITPKGIFKIKSIFYRKDRITHFKSKIKSYAIEKNMGWCDESLSSKYNKLIRFPFKFRAEKLHRTDNVYDIILVLNYNHNPIKKNKGSAIFIHVAKKNYKSTAGCVAVNKKSLLKIIKLINKETKVRII